MKRNATASRRKATMQQPAYSSEAEIQAKELHNPSVVRVSIRKLVRGMFYKTPSTGEKKAPSSSSVESHLDISGKKSSKTNSLEKDLNGAAVGKREKDATDQQSLDHIYAEVERSSKTNPLEENLSGTKGGKATDQQSLRGNKGKRKKSFASVLENWRQREKAAKIKPCSIETLNVEPLSSKTIGTLKLFTAQKNSSDRTKEICEIFLSEQDLENLEAILKEDKSGTTTNQALKAFALEAFKSKLKGKTNDNTSSLPATVHEEPGDQIEIRSGEDEFDSKAVCVPASMYKAFEENTRPKIEEVHQQADPLPTEMTIMFREANPPLLSLEVAWNVIDTFTDEAKVGSDITQILIGSKISNGSGEQFTEFAFLPDSTVARAVQILRNKGVQLAVGRWNLPGLPYGLRVDVDSVPSHIWRRYQHELNRDSGIFIGGFDKEGLDSLKFGYVVAELVAQLKVAINAADDQLAVTFHDSASKLGLVLLQNWSVAVITRLGLHPAPLNYSGASAPVQAKTEDNPRGPSAKQSGAKLLLDMPTTKETVKKSNCGVFVFTMKQ